MQTIVFSDYCLGILQIYRNESPDPKVESGNFVSLTEFYSCEGLHEETFWGGKPLNKYDRLAASEHEAKGQHRVLHDVSVEPVRCWTTVFALLLILWCLTCSFMEIFFAAVWLSLALSLVINISIHRTAGYRKDLSPLCSLHLMNSILFTGLYVTVFLPGVSQNWMNPTSMLWRTDPFICRTFTAISDSLVTSLTCSLTAIITQRPHSSKTDISSDFWMVKLTIYATLFGLLASVVYSVAIPLISAGYIISGVANCPGNAGIILNSPVAGSLIISNSWLGTLLHMHRGPAGGWQSFIRVIQRVGLVISVVTCGCTIGLGVTCLPLHLIGISLVSPLYNTTRLYLAALVLASCSCITVLYGDISVDAGSSEAQGRTKKLTRIQSIW